MNDKVKEYLEKKRLEREKKSLKKQRELLLELGLYELEFSPDNRKTKEYPDLELDPADKKMKYCKKVPIQVSDEDYSEIIKQEKNGKNYISSILKALSWLFFVGGSIGGIFLGYNNVSQNAYYSYASQEFSLATASICWVASFISGMVFLGFAEIIQLLEDIKNK